MRKKNSTAHNVPSRNVSCATYPGVLVRKTGPLWFSMCSSGSEITPGSEVLSSGLCNLQHQVGNSAGSCSLKTLSVRTVFHSDGITHGVKGHFSPASEQGYVWHESINPLKSINHSICSGRIDLHSYTNGRTRVCVGGGDLRLHW